MMSCSEKAQDATVLVQGPDTETQPFDLARSDFSRLVSRGDLNNITSPPIFAGAYSHDAVRDDGAEKGLGLKVRQDPGKSIEGMPCLHVIPIVEHSGDVSILDENGIVAGDLNGPKMDSIASDLKHDQSSTTTHVVPDSDDHARAFLPVNRLEQEITTNSVLKHSGSEGKRVSSIASIEGSEFNFRCNALISSTEAPDLEDGQNNMECLLASICEAWWNGDTMEKGSTSTQFTMMLLAKAFVRVLEMCDQGRTDHLSKKLTQFKVPLALVQIHNRTLMAQALAAVRGSEQLPETLAYAILTLKELQCLPWPDGSIKENRRFIEANQYTLELCREDWMARSSAKAYCMAATMVYTQPRPWTEMTASLFQVPQRALQDVTRQFSRLPDFQGIPFWKIEASVNEGLMFLPELRAHRKGLPNDIPLTRKDEFLVFIPTTCVVLNNLSYLKVPSGILWDTMIWILGLYRIDEYIETELKAMQADDIEDLRRFITTICEARSEDPDSLNKAELHFSSSSANVYTKSEGATALLYRHNSEKMEAVHVVLRSYINSMLLHPAVTAGPASAIKPLRLAIAEFMNGQLSQSLLNSDLASQRLACYSSTIPVYRTPQCFTSYLRDIGSPTFGANVAFAFFICLVGGLPTLKARYLGDQYAERMGRMSRLFNDLTGIERDQDEGNLNCVNFAEFHEADNGMDEGPVRTEDDMGAVSGRTSEMAKQRLENLAIYEREQMYTVGQQLVEEIRRVGGEGTEKKVGVVKLIGQVLKLYTDLYGVRDLSNRIERTEWLPRL